MGIRESEFIKSIDRVPAGRWRSDRLQQIIIREDRPGVLWSIHMKDDVAMGGAMIERPEVDRITRKTET